MKVLYINIVILVNMITLDGSHMEGGGALVRVALALSTLTGQEFKVTKIRANRPEPGLKAQHLEAIKALEKICGAETNVITLGSTKLHYKPGKIKKGIFEIDIGTAGSISLVLQALLVPCLFAPGKITLKIKGGTCGKWQASVDYLQNVLLHYMQRFAEKIELKMLKRGYYPKGGGEISIEIHPRFPLDIFYDQRLFFEELEKKVPKLNLKERGDLQQIKGVINLSQELQEKDVGERIKKAAEETLRNCGAPVNIRVEYAKTLSVGGELVLWATFGEENKIILGSDALIEKGKSSEEVGREAAQKLLQEIKSDNNADQYLIDQLIPFLALLPGSEVRIKELTEHAKTNIHIVEKFLAVKLKLEKGILASTKSKDL